MSVTGPNTGFKIVNVDGGPYTQDLGQRYVSKDYLLDVYPNIAYNVLGNRTSPGLYVWGANSSNGSLGLASTAAHRSSPVQLGTLTNWKRVTSSPTNSYVTQFSLAIKTDGTLWAWGHNLWGQLGLSDVTPRSSPVQVGALTNWKSVACADNSSLAIKTDGTLWTWGNNGSGQLGLSDQVHRSSPVQVGSLTNWKQVSGGSSYWLSVKTDGTLWACGIGSLGCLGLGTNTSRSSPTQVGSLTNWKQVAAGYPSDPAAIKTDGTLWTWGNNDSGQLGNNNRGTNRSSPIQVGSLTNWKQVSCGWTSKFALKTDGTLWSWGWNDGGQLGLSTRDLGQTAGKSSPVQIGSLTNWNKISSASQGACAIKTDGTLWAWGLNTHGILGDGTKTDQSSPIQIGTLNNWKQIDAGCGYNAFGILDWSV